MKLSTLASRLPNNIDVSVVTSEVDIVKKELNDDTAPVFRDTLGANLFTSKQQFMNPWVRKRNQQFMTALSGRPKGNIVEVTLMGLGNINEILDWVKDDFISNTEGPVLAKDAIGYQQLSVLQVFEAARFYVRYARRLLLAIYAYEAPDYVAGSNSYDNFPFTKAEILQLEESFGDFIKATSLFARPSKDIKATIRNLPDIAVGADESIVKTIIGNKADPLKVGLIASPWDISWLIGSSLAERQVQRLEAAKVEAQALELRILQMKLTRQQTQDASLDARIEKTEARALSYRRKVAELEKRYA